LKSLGAEGAQETAREATILKDLQAMLAEKGSKARNVNVCAPGFHVFSKFVKLPPVDAGKVTQIIQYEAQQNVPFPLAEVVWDYQILGSTPGGELEVLLVAIKSDIVEGLFRVTESAGLHLQVADVSPAALCNAFRYNYGDLEDCTVLLDIGAKSMRCTAQFFAEKLNVPVEFFNPLRNVQIDPAINLEELARVAHSLGEVVGLGLRNLAHCPVELNLMPESTLRWQAFNQKKPYFMATVFSLVAVVAAMGFIFTQLADVRRKELDKTIEEVRPDETRAEQFKAAFNNLNKTRKDVEQVVDWVNNQYYWADVLTQLRNVLIRVETGAKSKFRADAGVWVERMITMPEGGEGEVPAAAATGGGPVGQPQGMSDSSLARF